MKENSWIGVFVLVALFALLTVVAIRQVREERKDDIADATCLPFRSVKWFEYKDKMYVTCLDAKGNVVIAP